MAKIKNVNEQEVAVTIEPLSAPTLTLEQVTEQVEKEKEPVNTRMLLYTGSGSYTTYDDNIRYHFVSGAGNCPMAVEEHLAERLLKTGLFKEAS